MRFKILLIIFFLNLNINLYSNELVEESKIHKNLRCLVCQGQSIADSNSDFALTLKMVVKDLIDQGKQRRKYIVFYRINMETGFYISLKLTQETFYFGAYHT